MARQTIPLLTNTQRLNVINATKRVIHMPAFHRSVYPVTKIRTRTNLEKTASAAITLRDGKTL